jgi:GT2 family glycosyltransferase
VSNKIQLSQSPNPRVSIIIASSVRTDLLQNCLRSLARFAPNSVPHETIVVLNETEQTIEKHLRDTVSGLEVTSSSVNLGFAGAANRGRSLACGEYVLLLHDDAEVLPGWMEALVEAADSNPEAGAVGGTVLFPDGRLQNAGNVLWRDALTTPRWVGEAPSPTAFQRLEAVDYCGTSSLLVRASAWDAVGGLDEQFYPAYYADVDLSMALRRTGYIVLYQPNSTIHHHWSSSTGCRFRQFLLTQNKRRFIAKWEAELAQHEAYESNSLAAVERAMARTNAAAERCRDIAVRPLMLQRSFDPDHQDLEAKARSSALQKAYTEYLENLINEVEAERNHLGEGLALQRTIAHGALRQMTLDGHYERALRLATEMRDEDPNDATAYFRIGQCLYTIGRDAEEAIAALTLAEQLGYGERFWLLYFRGALHARQNRPDAALKDLRQAVALDAAHVDASNLYRAVEEILRQRG